MKNEDRRYLKVEDEDQEVTPKTKPETLFYKTSIYFHQLFNFGPN